MKKVIDHIIRQWLKKYNFLFSRNEIDDLVGMLDEELSRWDWADLLPGGEEEIYQEILEKGR
jgi:hypothetical protein